MCQYYLAVCQARLMNEPTNKRLIHAIKQLHTGDEVWVSFYGTDDGVSNLPQLAVLNLMVDAGLSWENTKQVDYFQEKITKVMRKNGVPEMLLTGNILIEPDLSLNQI